MSSASTNYFSAVCPLRRTGSPRRLSAGALLIVALFHSIALTESLKSGEDLPFFSMRPEIARPIFDAPFVGGTLNANAAQAITNPTICTEKIPIYHSIYAGYWSDKLALTPYRDYFSLGSPGRLQRLTAQLLNQSFDIAGVSAEESSRKITEAVKNGLSIYGSSTIILLCVEQSDIIIDVRTSADMQIDLPGAPFLIVFSEDNGLRRGADLPLTHCGIQARICTDITASYGKAVDLSMIADGINWLLFKKTDLACAEWRYGLTATLGNAFIDMGTTQGGVHLSGDGGRLFLDAVLHSKSSGVGILHGGSFGITQGNDFPITGFGAGLNMDLILYGDHASLGFGLHRVGPMVWNNLQEEIVTVRTRNISVDELLDKNFSLVDTEKNGALHYKDTGNSRGEVPSLRCWEPAKLTIGFGYRFTFNSQRNGFRGVLPENISTSIEYEQNLTPWPGRLVSPLVIFSSEIGFMRGFVPLRLGCSFGGAKKVASSMASGLVMRKISFMAGYEAIGTPYWYPKRGCGVFLGFRYSWGHDHD
jgi:hypothetical protein